MHEKKHSKRPPDRKPEPNPNAATDAHGDEQQSHGNYVFALKVLLILAAIILVIVVLQALGVPIAVKDWIASFSANSLARPVLPFPLR